MKNFEIYGRSLRVLGANMSQALVFLSQAHLSFSETTQLGQHDVTSLRQSAPVVASSDFCAKILCGLISRSSSKWLNLMQPNPNQLFSETSCSETSSSNKIAYYVIHLPYCWRWHTTCMAFFCSRYAPLGKARHLDPSHSLVWMLCAETPAKKATRRR